jgi:mono/diheme cytochrome c family protein
MENSMSKWRLAIPALAALAALLATAQQKAAPAGPKAGEFSGAEAFRTYCASCHGTDGTGAGPAAAALKRRPPDLTLICARNNGRFPAFRIAHVIDGYFVAFAHGSRDMPVWGDYFRGTKRDDAVTALREHNLTEFIRSIQQK